MTDKDIVDSLQSLAEIQRGQFDKRRSYEWRIFFTMVTFYCLAAAASRRNDISLPSATWFGPIVWSIFLLLAGLSAGALWFIHHANNTNKRIAEDAEKTIQDVLNGAKPTRIDLYSRVGVPFRIRDLFLAGPTGLWTWTWQLIVMMVFAIASARIITC